MTGIVADLGDEAEDPGVDELGRFKREGMPHAGNDLGLRVRDELM